MIYKSVLEKCSVEPIGKPSEDWTSDFDRLRNRLGGVIPEELDTLFREVDGRALSIDGQVGFPYEATDMNRAGSGSFELIYGIGGERHWDVIARTEKLAKRLGENLLVLAENPGGDFLVCSVRDGNSISIGFWCHDEPGNESAGIGKGNVHFVANSFRELELLCEFPPKVEQE
jgi:hypothetical protein